MCVWRVWKRNPFLENHRMWKRNQNHNIIKISNIFSFVTFCSAGMCNNCSARAWMHFFAHGSAQWEVIVLPFLSHCVYPSYWESPSPLVIHFRMSFPLLLAPLPCWCTSYAYRNKYNKQKKSHSLRGFMALNGAFGALVGCCCYSKSSLALGALVQGLFLDTTFHWFLLFCICWFKLPKMMTFFSGLFLAGAEEPVINLLHAFRSQSIEAIGMSLHFLYPFNLLCWP